MSAFHPLRSLLGRLPTPAEHSNDIRFTKSRRSIPCSRRVWSSKHEIVASRRDGIRRNAVRRQCRNPGRPAPARCANAADGALGEAMVGGFVNGRGEFYNQEMLGNRAIQVRFIFSGISARTFRIEQAFSADGGKSWETNWISDFTKVGS
jgi:hypothetical protein